MPGLTEDQSMPKTSKVLAQKLKCWTQDWDNFESQKSALMLRLLLAERSLNICIKKTAN